MALPCTAARIEIAGGMHRNALKKMLVGWLLLLFFLQEQHIYGTKLSVSLCAGVYVTFQ